jgi:plastocyanin
MIQLAPGMDASTEGGTGAAETAFAMLANRAQAKRRAAVDPRAPFPLRGTSELLCSRSSRTIAKGVLAGVTGGRGRVLRAPPERLAMRPRHALTAVVGALCVAAHALAATKIVEVGPGGTLTFGDQETGSSTTTITAGDSVQWVWQSSGHSTTSDGGEEGWDSGVQDAPFTFTRQFLLPGSFPYHCIPHQFLGMTGRVVVRPSGEATTSTTLPPVVCNEPQAVAAVRAQIDAACDCASAPSHRKHVRCAARVIAAALKAGALPAACKPVAKRCAAQSTCGRPGFVTCCRTNAGGAQTCSIKRSAAACRRPRGGTACVGDRSSCCDACGGATCPAPAMTTTTSTTPASTTTMPGGSSPKTTTTTMPSMVNSCDGLAPCAGVVCVLGPALCPDGTPALWFGTATSVSGSVDIAFTLCASDAFVSGAFFCLPGSLPCFLTESAFFGTILVTADGITILFDPLVFGDGTSCTFDELLVGLTMGGDFFCVDPFGFTVSAGTWEASRCP